MACSDDVINNIDRPFERTSHTTCKSDDFVVSIAYCGYAVQGSFDTGAVIATKLANALLDEVEIVFGNEDIAHSFNAVTVAGFGWSPVVEDDLDEAIQIVAAL